MQWTHASQRLGGAALACSLFLVLLQGPNFAADSKTPDVAPFLAEEEMQKLVDEAGAILMTEFAEKEPNLRKVRDNALLVALAAQYTKEPKDAKKVATLRDAAVKLAGQLGEKPNLDEAKKQADRIAKFKELQADPKADPKPIDLAKHFERLKDVMHVYGKTSEGGQGLERTLLDLSSKRKFGTADKDKIVNAAHKTALLAYLTLSYRDRFAKNDEQKKQWDEMSHEMHKSALGAVELVKSSKPDKELKAGVEKLNSQCFDCHQAFKVNRIK